MREPAELGKIVKNIESQFSGIDTTVKVNVKSQGIASTIKQVKELKQATMEANSVAESLAKTFAVSFKRFVTFSLATRTVGTFTSGLSSAFNEAIDFEKQMVRVSQVTGKSLPELRDLNKEITRLSVGLGVSSKTLLDVSLTLAQAGFTANDTRIALEALAKTELAPTFTDIKKTTEGAIALFNQFGEGADALAGQLGAINKVSADFAVESDDLIDVVRRVGGVFKSSGGSLNELLAIFTSVRATTRESAESIGTALKTIFVRIQRPQTLKYLKDLGVDLVDLEGKFVGPLKATELLNKAFGKLEQGDPKFIQIAEELGGYRQIGKVIPLLQQYAVTQKALESARKGQGSLDADAIKAQETLANKIVKVKEEFAALVRTIYESPVFQTLANSSLQFASALIKVGESLKNIIPLIGLFATLKVAKTAGSFLGSFGRNLKNPQGFADGGPVPGVGNKDSVPAMLMPGEFVLNKKAVSKIGMGKLNTMNSGGAPDTNAGVQYFAKGGPVEPKAYKLKDSTVSGMFLRPLNYGINADKPSKYTLSSSVRKIRGKGNNKEEVAIVAGSSIDIHEVNLDGIKDQTIPQLDSLVSKSLGELSNAYTKKFGELTGKSLYLKPDVAKAASAKLSGPEAVGVRNTISGYLFEPVVSAITGRMFEGEQSGFDFDFKTGQGNLDRDNFSKFFTGNLSQNAVVSDAKYSLTSDSKKSIFEKANNFILNNPKRVSEIADEVKYSDVSELDQKFKNVNKKGRQKASSSDTLLIQKILEITKKKISGTQKNPVETIVPKFLPSEAEELVKLYRGTNATEGKVQRSALAKAGKTKENFRLEDIIKLNTGGPVPGIGNRDTVPAMLTPGEFVLNKEAVREHGMAKLAQMNGGNSSSSSGGVQYFKAGGAVATGGVDNFTKLAGASILISTVSESLVSVTGPATDLGKALSVLTSSIVQGGVLLLLLNQGLKKASDGMDDFRKNELIKKGNKTRPERLDSQITSLKKNDSKLLVQQADLEKKKQQTEAKIQKEAARKGNKIAEKGRAATADLTIAGSTPQELAKKTEDLAKLKKDYERQKALAKDPTISRSKELKSINEQIAQNKEQQAINSKRIDSRVNRLPEKPVKLTSKQIEETRNKAAQAQIQLDANKKQLSSTYSAKSVKANADKLGYRKEYDAAVAANLERNKAPKGSVYASVAEEDFQEKAKALREKIDSKKTEQNKKLQEMVDKGANLPAPKRKRGSTFGSLKDFNLTKARTGANNLFKKGFDPNAKIFGADSKAIGVGVGTAGLVGSQIVSEYGNYKDTQAKKDIEGGDYAKAREKKASSINSGLLSGAIGGAATGAAIGSLFGPIGAGVGAAAGGLFGFVNELSTVGDKMKTFNLDIFNATIESSTKSLRSFNDGLIKIDAFTADLQKNFAEGSKSNDEAMSQATLGEKAARYNPFKGTGSYENATYDPFAYIASGVEALGGGNNYRKDVYGDTKADFDPKTTSGMRSIQNLYTDKEKKEYLENENKSALSLADNVRNVQGTTEVKLKAYNTAIEALTTRSNELIKIDSEASRLAAERNTSIKNIISSEKALLELQQKQLVINTDRLKLSSKLNSFSLDLEDKIAGQKPETRRGSGDNFIRRQEFADKNIGGSNNANLAIDSLIKTVTPLVGENSKELAELKRQGEERKAINIAKDTVLSGGITLDRNDATQTLVDQLKSKLAPILGSGEDGQKRFEALGITETDLQGGNAEASIKINEKLQSFDAKYSEKNTQLKEAAEAEIRIREIMTKKVEESISILEKKNELDKSSVKSLLDGDIMSFIKQQQAQGAQAALAGGDNRLARSFGAQAIGGALQNAEDQKALGATSIYGMDINKFARTGAEQGLALRGIKDPGLAAAYAGETPELAQQKALLKNKDLLLGEGLKLLGTPALTKNPIPNAADIAGYNPKNEVEAKKQSSSINEAAKSSVVTTNSTTSASVSGNMITEKDLSNLATFTSSVKELSAAVEKLSQSRIQISLAPTQHTVNITSSGLLEGITKNVEAEVYKAVELKMKDLEEKLRKGQIAGF